MESTNSSSSVPFDPYIVTEDGSRSTKSLLGYMAIRSFLFLTLGIVIGYFFSHLFASPKTFEQTNLQPKTCTPRPVCLDGTPRCMIPETGDMCPPTPIGDQNITELKYKIKIPPTWKKMDGGNYQTPDGSTFVLTVLVNHDSLTEYLAKQDKVNQTSWEGLPSKKLISSKKTTVAGLPAIQRVEEWLAADFITINTYTLIDRTIYSFYIIPSEIPYDQTIAFKEYQNILDSFEPINLTSGIACPTTDYVDCMPGPEAMKPQCSPDFISWATANCPNFKGAAL